jgi:hypothetical protein
MDESAKNAMRQCLQRWMQERHQALSDQVMSAWKAHMDQLDPDNALLEKIISAATPSSDQREIPESPFGDSPTDMESDLGNGLDLIESASSQADVLKRMIDSVQPFTERSALFIVKQGIATLYSVRGFESDTPRLGVPVVPPKELDDLIQGRTAVVNAPGPAYEALLATLSHFEASDIRVFPLKLRRKVVALLLVDSGLRQVFDHPHHVRALVHAAEANLAALSTQREEEKPVTQVTPAEPLHAIKTQRIPEAITESEGATLDPKIRANAERSARVLVGDIELYFPEKVSQGQAKHNLYALLHDEFDRSRASFIERYGVEVENKHHIFYKTLVQQLCNGDPSVLGTVPWSPRG